MVTALAIAGSHAGWIVYVCVLVCTLTNTEAETSARIRLLALIDPWSDAIRSFGRPICLLICNCEQRGGFERP